MKIKEKVTEFCKKHKVAIRRTVIGLGCFGLGCYAVKKLSDRHDEVEDIPEQNLLSATNDTYEETMSYDDQVRENRSDDFAKMFDFADQFKVRNGESWIIAGPNSEYNYNDDDIDIYLVDSDCNYILGKRPEETETEENSEVEPTECDSGLEWKEELYREDYEKVKAFSDELDLKPGEMWCIEDGTEYNHDAPIVSHLIYGDGVYPPDEEE